MTSKPVYLDYQATTPLDPAVHEVMQPYWQEHFGNPHSIGHDYGAKAAQAIRLARAQVADFIHSDDEEIVFTSGATESCNLALRGIAALASEGERNRIITVVTEHAAVLETVRYLGKVGADTIFLPVESNGILDIERLDAVLDERTLLVSVMAANNEIGVLQPLSDIAARCHEVGALLHTDASQASGRLLIDVDEWGVDLLSLSAHKMYGPKGIGILFIRSGLIIQPMVTGGGQENGKRSGTVATPLVVGFGQACTLARRQLSEDRKRIDDLTSRLYEQLKEACPSIRLFGDPENRLPGSLSIGFPGVPADHVVRNLRNQIAISTGSACTSTHTGPSRVLLALGLDPETADTALRISVGRFTTEDDLAFAVRVLSTVRSNIF